MRNVEIDYVSLPFSGNSLGYSFHQITVGVQQHQPMSRIDVLANDRGVPPQSEIELAIEPAPAPACGKVDVEGGAIWYEAGADCVGVPVRFRYRVKLRDPRTCDYEWQTTTVTVLDQNQP